MSHTTPPPKATSASRRCAPWSTSQSQMRATFASVLSASCPEIHSRGAAGSTSSSRAACSDMAYSSATTNSRPANPVSASARGSKSSAPGPARSGTSRPAARNVRVTTWSITARLPPPGSHRGSREEPMFGLSIPSCPAVGLDDVHSRGTRLTSSGRGRWRAMRTLPRQPASAELPHQLVPRPIVHTDRDVRGRVGFLALRHQADDPFEWVGTLQQRPRTARLAVPEPVDDGLRSHLQVDDQVAIAQLFPIFRVDEGASSGADHLVLRGHDVVDGFALDLAKAGFTVPPKNLRDGPPRHLFDAPVAVHERQPQASGDVATERCFATAAEADQDQVVHHSTAVSRFKSTFSVTAKVGQCFLEAVAAELEAHGIRQDQRHHGLADDARRRDDAHVAALDVRHAALAGGVVDGRQWMDQRRDRFGGPTHDQRRTVGHPTLEPTRPVRRPDPTAFGVVVDHVVRLGPWPGGIGKRVTEFDRFDRLNAHDRRRQSAVEALVPLAVAAETDRQPVTDDFEDAAESIAGRTGSLDELDGAIFERFVAGPNRRLLDLRPPGVVGRVLPQSERVGRIRPRGAHTPHVAADFNPELAQEHLAERAGGHARGGFARARTFEHVANVAEAELDHARQVGVTGPQPGHRRRWFGHRFDVHLALPVCPIPILDDHRDRPTHGQTVSHAGDDLHAVVFDLLTPTAPVALLATGEVDIDVLSQNGEPGGQVLDEDGELWAVRFAGRDHAQVAQAHRRWPWRITSSYARMGASWPVQRSNARAAWCSNMPNPFSARAPASRAATMKPVSGGL